MKRFLSIAIASVLAASAMQAQNISTFTRRLAQPDSLNGATIKVMEHGSASSAIAGAERNIQTKVKGFRIRIFSDNSQNARATAHEVESSFREQFSGIPTYVSYENPYFMVSVGNCADEEEALILLGKVKSSFNKAFMVQTEIPIADFL